MHTLKETFDCPIDDSSSEWRGKGEDPISIGMLKEVIRASMSAFWEFLRADKDEMHASTQMDIPSIQFDLQDPLDVELLIEIHSNLQKVFFCAEFCPPVGFLFFFFWGGGGFLGLSKKFLINFFIFSTV